MICENCGNRLGKHDKFCQECGHPVNRKKRRTSPILIVVIVIFAVLAILYFIGDRSLKEKESAYTSSAVITETAQYGESVSVNQDPETASAEDGWTETILELYPDGNAAIEDFVWFEDGVLAEGVPASRIDIDTADLNGFWKYCLIVNRNPAFGERYEEAGIAYVTVAGEQATIDLNPQEGKADGEVFDVNPEDVGYETFEGVVSENGIMLSGNGANLDIEVMYQSAGVQYGVGSAVLSDGSLADFLLVRP